MSAVGLGVGLRRRRSLRWKLSLRMRWRRRRLSMGCQSLLLWTLSSAVPELWFSSSGGVCVCVRVCREPLYL